jgi:hypothetical protein
VGCCQVSIAFFGPWGAYILGCQPSTAEVIVFLLLLSSAFAAESPQDAYAQSKRSAERAEALMVAAPLLAVAPLAIVLAQQSDPLSWSDAQSGVALGGLVLGGASMAAALPWMAASGLRAQRLVVSQGGAGRPGLGQEALWTYGAGMVTLVGYSSALLLAAQGGTSLPGWSAAAAFGVGGGLLLTSAVLGVAQIENLNRVGLAGPEQGTAPPLNPLACSTLASRINTSDHVRFARAALDHSPTC